MTIPPFLIPLAVGLFAQALKPLFSKMWREDQAHRLDPRPRYGGMPSAHTAFATSLTTITILTEGIDSLTFALAVAFLIFVIDDALRLRVFLGRFGTAIRHLAFILPIHSRERLPLIEERMGHTIPEVVVGALIGLTATLALWSLDI